MKQQSLSLKLWVSYGSAQTNRVGNVILLRHYILFKIYPLLIP